jgi:surfeit locus 1 family protein
MPIRIPIGSRSFAPTWPFTALTVILCVLFFLLGRWQWHRGQARQALWDRFAVGAEQLVPLGTRSVDEVPVFQRISLVGTYDADHQFLLDNRIDQGRPGYEVLTPLRRPNGRAVLIDRGWLPFTGFHDRLPEVALSEHEPVTVNGRVANLPTAGLASGRVPPAAQAQWPRVTSFPTMSQLSSSLGTALEPRIVLLDRGAPNGYARDWHPPGIDPLRNWSYALQWWCFGLLTLGLWIRFSLRRIEVSP